MVGFPIDQFRVAPISPFFGVIGRGIEGLAATTYRKWAEQGNLINIPLKQPVFFGCKLKISRKIFICLLQNCPAQAVAEFSVIW